MVFSSLTFLCLFLPALLLFYFIIKDCRWRNGVLIVASLLFYGWGEPVWILAMIFSTVVNFFCAKVIDSCSSERKRKLFLTIGILISVAFLIYFKYTLFFLDIFSSITGISIEMPDIRMPIGISFYTFQILTYTVDVYRKKTPVQKSLARLLLYVSCFPQLIAGPIVQYSDIADSLEDRQTTAEDFTSGMSRFVTGLAKKVIIANICGAALNKTVQAGTGQDLSLLGAWLSAFLYTLQIYFDFSAYSDMAIGLGRILGFEYKENFNYPYSSVNVSDYWHRWHISLSSFFRDYVYIPLGGNRRGTLMTIRNMLIVWMLTGFWHGASWNFIFWGLYYGIILILERFVISGFVKKLPRALGHVFTMIIVMVGWVIFYYTDLPAVGQHILAMAGMGVKDGAVYALALSDASAADVLKQYSVFPILAFILCLPVVPGIRNKLEATPAGEKVSRVCSYVLVPALAVLSIIFLVGQSYNPFIYFRF